jgi:hypothetical protein
MPLLVLVLFASVLALSARPSSAQDRPDTVDAAETVPSPPPAPAPRTHKFWDTTNTLLFVGVAGSRAFDYASTRHFRRRGVHEALLNDRIVDDKPLFIAIEAAGTAAQIGACAWLHKKGHHKLERWISVVHIGITSYGATRNYTLGRGIEPR